MVATTDNVVGVAMWAAFWCFTCRASLPAISQWAQRAPWWPAGKVFVKRTLWHAGFPRSPTAALPNATTDAIAADMFAWISVSSAVAALAGGLLLGLQWLGTSASPSGHAAFVMAMMLAMMMLAMS